MQEASSANLNVLLYIVFIVLQELCLDLIFFLFWHFKKSDLYLTYNAASASRDNGI